MERERWKEIPGFDDYFVSSAGRIRSFKAKGNGKLLSQPKNTNGYLFVNIMGNDGFMHVKRVHVLVCLAFIGPRPRGMEICHRDCNKENNSPENLRYDTPLGNSRDTISHRIKTVPDYYEYKLKIIDRKQKSIIRHYLTRRGMEMYLSGAGMLREIGRKVGITESGLSWALKRAGLRE